jgi:hypothetical protein
MLVGSFRVHLSDEIRSIRIGRAQEPLYNKTMNSHQTHSGSHILQQQHNADRSHIPISRSLTHLDPTFASSPVPIGRQQRGAHDEARAPARRRCAV